MTHRTLIVGFALALAGLGGGCWKSVKARVVGSPDAGQRALLVMRSSTFKDQVVKRVLAALKPLPVSVEVRGVGGLERIDPARYQVILIVDEYRAWSISSAVSRFVKRLGPEARSKVVFFTTAGDPKAARSQLPKGVDALSCASKGAELAKAAVHLVAGAKKRLRSVTGPRPPTPAPPTGKPPARRK